MNEHDHVPSPGAVAEAVARLNRATTTTFELDLEGWRTIWLADGRPLVNTQHREQTIIYYRPMLVIATPYLPAIDGQIALTVVSLETGKCTWLVGQRSATVGFRACNEHSANWLRMNFARVSGMRFREHGALNPDKIIYTRDA